MQNACEFKQCLEESHAVLPTACQALGKTIKEILKQYHQLAKQLKGAFTLRYLKAYLQHLEQVILEPQKDRRKSVELKPWQ